jgi:hypothetical protein
MGGQVTVPELLQMIGEQSVQIALLQRELARVTALVTPADPPRPADAPPSPLKAVPAPTRAS